MTVPSTQNMKKKGSARHFWLRAGEYSLLLDRRPTLLAVALTLLVIALGIYGAGIGGSSLTHREVIEVLRGAATAGQELIVIEWRLPRILAAITVGIALGVSGSIFQTITQNPLGSPDLIGFTMGAQTGILVGVIVMGSSLASITTFSLLGGLSSGLIIYLLAAQGGFGRLRLILCGVAISSMLGSVNRWLIVQADTDTAYGAMKAVTGTLAKVSWEVAGPCMIGIGVTVCATLLFKRVLDLLLLGTELSTVLGVRLNLCQGLLVLLGVTLVAFSTIIAGPISFVALLAPHIARSISKTPNAPLLVSGLTGALLLLGADLLSQSLFENLPVGIVTAAVGGFYFMALLVMEARKNSARTL
ncbi:MULTISPECIES: FecCD family ABC transporter permease [Rothia]|uniref:FecCD family ABC transporter permease n=1 Tax=Rothia TaxID=32207 RepID=UPI0009F67002|nr:MULTISPECIES: iron chelate uptake ABC transporter family permease subunit [Rothia]